MFERKITLAEDYHFSSRNNKGYKFLKNEHLIHYREDIIKLKSKSYIEYFGNSYQLPPPYLEDHDSFKRVIQNRKSRRNFNKSAIDVQKLSNILYFSNGYRDVEKGQKYVPSSGGLNSVELFVIVLNSIEIEKGIYYYNPNEHQLTTIHTGDFATWTREHIFYQDEYSDASCVVVLASLAGKLTMKYGLRSYRLALLDIGHVSQNIYLLGSASDVQVCASAGFIDDEIDQALNFDGFNITTQLTIMLGF